MEKIIKELKQSKQHELNQVGLTPRTNFEGSQELHDLKHELMADEYQKAIDILTEWKNKIQDE